MCIIPSVRINIMQRHLTRQQDYYCCFYYTILMYYLFWFSIYHYLKDQINCLRLINVVFQSFDQ